MTNETIEPCERARAAAAFEVDDALSQLERAFLDAHVAQCADCRVFRCEIEGLTATIRAAPLAPFRAQLVLPSRRRVLSAASRVAAVAATVAVALTSLVNVPDVERSASPERAAAARPAYYESVDYELELIRVMLDRDQGTRTRVAI